MRGALLSGLLPLAAGLAVPQQSPSPSNTSSFSSTVTVIRVATGAEATSAATSTTTFTPLPTVTPTLIVAVASTISSSGSPKHSLLPTPLHGKPKGKDGLRDEYSDTKGQADRFQLSIHPRLDDSKYGYATRDSVNDIGTTMVLVRAPDLHHKSQATQRIWAPTFHPDGGPSIANESTAILNLRSGGVETDDKASSNHVTLHLGMRKNEDKKLKSWAVEFTTKPVGLWNSMTLQDHWVIRRAPHRSEYYELVNTKEKNGEFAACESVHGSWITGPSAEDANIDNASDMAQPLELTRSLHYGQKDALEALPKEQAGIKFCYPVVLVATWDHNAEYPVRN